MLSAAGCVRCRFAAPRLLASLPILLSTCIGVVHAQDWSRDNAVLAGAGIDGRWARDCGKPPSAKNEYLVVQVPDNAGPRLQMDFGQGDEGAIALSGVRLLGNGDVEWVQAEGEVMLTVQTQLRGNKMRTWSVVSSDGRVDVVGGKDSNGAATPSFSKCETN